MGAYKGKASVFKEADDKAEGFKRGGKAKADMKVMGAAAKAHAGRKARKAGGSVLSSAGGSGTPRGKASHY